MPDEIIKQTNQYDFSRLTNFTKLAKLTLKDLRDSNKDSLFFSKFTKEDIIKYLKNPDKNEKNLRNACVYLYNSSSHFKRLVQYFACLCLMQYIVIPYKLDVDNVEKDEFLSNYKTTLNTIETLNVKHEFIKVLTTAYREDVFYGYEYSTKDSYMIRKLNPDFCKINAIEDGVYNFAFNFSYFNSRKDELETFGDEFIEKYYKFAGNPHTKSKGNRELKWQELSSDKTICIKVNEDIEYSIPPFVGVLEAIYDLQDYKMLKRVKSQNDNYKVLTFKIPVDKNTGAFLLDEPLALKYYNMMENAIPDGIGLTLTPMDVDSFSFQNSATSERDAVAEATSEIFSSAGVSSLVFNNTSAGSTGLMQSIRSDEDIAFSVMRQLERWVNRKLKRLKLTYKFKLQFLDTTRYNLDEMYKLYMQAGERGLPVKTILSAMVGYNPSDTLSMGYLENDVLEMRDKICGQPLLSSNTMSGDNEGGRPTQDTVDESGQITRDTDGNDR